MDNIISIYKPKDITSQDAVTRVKRILKIKKAGHTGTLDPMATGLMLICTNRATRLAPYFSDMDKEYRAVMKLGVRTDTQDASGNVIESRDNLDISDKEIEDSISSFKGRIVQMPPMFSALKHRGKPLYKLARKGIEVERKPREVTIHNIEILDINLPFVSFRVRCSKGTYIRTLCDDIGEKLSSGAHLSELERTSVGDFSIEESITFDKLSFIGKGGKIDKGIYTMDEAMSWLPEYRINRDQLKPVMHGNPLKPPTGQIGNDLKDARGIRIKSPDGSLLAIGRYIDLKKIIKMNIVFT